MYAETKHRYKFGKLSYILKTAHKIIFLLLKDIIIESLPSLLLHQKQRGSALIVSVNFIFMAGWFMLSHKSIANVIITLQWGSAAVKCKARSGISKCTCLCQAQDSTRTSNSIIQFSFHPTPTPTHIISIIFYHIFISFTQNSI